MFDDFTAIWYLIKICVKKASDIDHKWSQLKTITGNYLRICCSRLIHVYKSFIGMISTSILWLTGRRDSVPLPTGNKLIAGFPSHWMAAPMPRASGIENEDDRARLGHQHGTFVSCVNFGWWCCSWAVIYLIFNRNKFEWRHKSLNFMNIPL